MRCPRCREMVETKDLLLAESEDSQHTVIVHDSDLPRHVRLICHYCLSPDDVVLEIDERDMPAVARYLGVVE